MNNSRTKSFIDYDAIEFENFLCDERGSIIGITGYDKNNDLVTIEQKRTYSENSKEPTFEMMTGRLQRGGFLKLRIEKTPDGNFVRWPSVLTWNAEETKRLLVQGPCFVDLMYPDDIKDYYLFLQNTEEGKRTIENKQRELVNVPAGKCIDILMRERFEGRSKMHVFFFMYDKDNILLSKDKKMLFNFCLHYFENPQFMPFTRSGKVMRYVYPHLIVRGFSSNGDLTGIHVYDQKDLIENNCFLGAEQSARKIVNNLPDGDLWDIIPGRVFRSTQELTKIGPLRSGINIKIIEFMNKKTRKNRSGTLHAINTTLLLDTDTNLVNDVVIDIHDKGINPKYFNINSVKSFANKYMPV